MSLSLAQRRSLLLFIVLGLPLSIGSVAAQVYRYTDAQGHTVFTDRKPVESAEQVNIPVTNGATLAAPRHFSSKASETKQASKDQAPYTRFQITGLDAQVIRANDGNINVMVILEPKLAASHRLRLLLDDAPYGMPTRQMTLPLKNIDRGEHSLAVQILEGDLEVQRSEPYRFTLQRASVKQLPKPRI